MLRVTIEIVPHGNEEEKEIISVLEIVNTGIKNIYNEFSYKCMGWWKQEDGEIRNIPLIKVDFDRREFVWKLVYRTVIKIIKPFGSYALRKEE